jgi:3'-phosphoadenosine 5'-phosphosulfate sulfotransferase (PAPS reductase)/FAD synthetase
MKFIFGNYGDNTLALIEWLHSRDLSQDVQDNILVINVDTGWSAGSWQERVVQCQALVTRYGYEHITLKPKLTFAELVQDRQEFPTSKYQWCPIFLKGLPVINFLEEVDSGCEGVILLGSSRSDSRARYQLPEYIHDSEHYGGRLVWHPLHDKSRADKHALIMQTGIPILNSRSFECHPCIHSTCSELKTLDPETISKVSLLEEEVAQTFLHARFPHQPLQEIILQPADSEAGMERFDAGCGSHFACGE